MRGLLSIEFRVMIAGMTQTPPDNDRWIQTYIDQTLATITELKSQSRAIGQISNLIAEALFSGHKLLTAGNGGSAAEALHLAEELTGRYNRSDRRALPALCLAADTTALTCIANDWDFSKVFSRQIEAFAQAGDVLVLFSTSGNSANVIAAAAVMRQRGGKVVGLLGKGGGKLLAMCDAAIVAAGAKSGAIQEAHQVILHLILERVEQYDTAG